MNKLKERKVYWIAGTAVAIIGVAGVRLIAPQLTGIISKVVLISGYVLSLAGIIIIAYAAKG